MYAEKRTTENLEEIVDVTLHSVENYKTSYVMTVYYPRVVSFHNASEMWEVIRKILTSNDLELSNVTIFYYYDDSYSTNDVYEWIFDHYLERFVGDRIEFTPVEELPEQVKFIHENMINKIQG